MITNRIVYGGGAQPWRHVPMDYRGWPTRVTSATYTIVDITEGTTSSSREVVASTAATLDAADDTLDGAAGRSSADPRLVSVNDASAFVEGRAYILSTVAGAGHRELVTAERVNATSNDVHTARQLQGTYATSDTLQGIELSATFPAAVADDEDLAIRDGREYQIVWSYTIDSRDYLVPELIVVQRYSVVPWITPEEATRGHNSIVGRVRSRSMVPDALAVATMEIEGELEADHPDAPAYYRPRTMGRVAVRYLTLSNLYYEYGNDDDREMGAMYRERYKAQMNKLRADAKGRFLSRHDDTRRSAGDYLDILVPT